MSRSKNKYPFLIAAILVVLGGCIEERTLRPFILPELVNTPNYLVESFPEDSVLLVAAEGGVLIRYADLRQYAFTVSNYPVLDEIDPTDVEVFYSGSKETFWLRSDSLIFSFSRERIADYQDTTAFYRPTRFYFDYCLSEDGVLHRVDYHDEIWDPQGGNFLSDYFIAVHRFEPSSRGLWKTLETDLSVRSDRIATPNAVFKGNELLILTNPSYRLGDVFSDELMVEEFPRDDAFDQVVDPVWNVNDVIYGLPSKPGFFSPFNVIIELPLEADNNQRLSLAGTCDPGVDVIGPVKVLQWTDEEVVLFVQYFTNELTTDNDVLGYIYTYGLKDASCEVNSVKSDPILLPFSNAIRDVALLNNELFIGTESGLLVYDFTTESMVPYLKNLFDEETR